ncbi:branched-chain amino acid transport system II carrier protein, partial [Bacillus subtilis]|uniref:branched-chain amino acid transport system II carrier protein n=1 Tax=Bacillus subtilis TaxID=1423 RepID=UPI001642750A
PELPQPPPHNLFKAIPPFLLTRLALPLLPIIPIPLTPNDAKPLPHKPHPLFPTIFTLLLYLSIPPLFPIPTTPTL